MQEPTPHAAPPGAALVSLTRLRLRSARYLPAFFWHMWRSLRQVRRVPGFHAGRLGRDAHGGYWTVTVWDDLAAMREYRNNGAHMTAMPKLMGWCDEASVAHWQQDQRTLPDAAGMLEKMRALGRVSKVRYPSAAHAAGQVAGSGAPFDGPAIYPSR
jgi:hypothetical protein